MKKTATNYLIEQLELTVMAQHIPWVAEILDKAIEMEHEQIIDAFEHIDFNLDDGEQYYNQTFNNESNN